jgi:hypothetical protein
MRHDQPAITIRFVDGPYDGLELTWTAGAATCPTAFTFEDHAFDRTPDEDASFNEAIEILTARKYLGARAHRYELVGMVCGPDAETWTFGYQGGGPVAHHQDEA